MGYLQSAIGGIITFISVPLEVYGLMGTVFALASAPEWQKPYQAKLLGFSTAILPLGVTAFGIHLIKTSEYTLE